MVNDNIAGTFLCNDMDLQVVEEVVENIVVVDKLYRQALSRVLIDLRSISSLAFALCATTYTDRH